MITPSGIFLGDAYKLIKEVPDKSVDLVVIDPPYEIEGGGGGGAFGRENRNYHAEVSDKLNYGIKNEILVELERVMKITNIYIFCNKNQLLQYLDFYKDKNIDLLVWNKTNPIPTVNNKYLSDLEYIVFARGSGAYFNNTYETSSKLFQTQINKADKELYEHSTIKPQWIVETLIKNSSPEGGVVLDCFSGSGTTCAAAKALGRNYIGFEIEEKWFKISLDRLKGITVEDRRAMDKGQISLFDFVEVDQEK